MVFEAEEFIHPVEASFLLVEVGMDIKIEGRGHVGMTE